MSFTPCFRFARGPVSVGGLGWWPRFSDWPAAGWGVGAGVPAVGWAGLQLGGRLGLGCGWFHFLIDGLGRTKARHFCCFVLDGLGFAVSGFGFEVSIGFRP